MAPFKLKFRMGGSRSTSQEVDADPQVNEALLNHSTNIGASSSTIDSADCTSLGSIGNEKKSLLPNKSNNLRLGYLNTTATQSSGDNPVPKSPPPSYEHVLEENSRLANSLDLGSRLTLSTEDGGGTTGDQTNSNLSSTHNIQDSRNNSSENISFEHHQITNTCTDPDCTVGDCDDTDDNRTSNNDDNHNNDSPRRNRKKSIDSTEYLISTMTAPSSQENLLDDCNGSEEDGSRACDPLLMSPRGQRNDACDEYDSYDQNEALNHNGTPNHPPPEYSQSNENMADDNGSDNDWDSNQHSQMSNSYQQNTIPSEYISNKSSKQMYKAVAKQWGITCKMSDQCRCMDCQSHYFDCDFDNNDHQKTDGGLGAGTPMFISEVMHGSACTIL